jgi:hypothetical protein
VSSESISIAESVKMQELAHAEEVRNPSSESPAAREKTDAARYV